MKKFIMIFFLLSISFIIKGQDKKEVTSENFPFFQASYGFALPGADLAKRFGAASSVSPAFFFKTKNNWLAGLSFSYMFGNKIKQDSLFHNLKTSTDEIIDGNGTYAQVYTFQRGIYPAFYIGKIFNFLSSNPNSGPCIMLSAGLFQHKIRIDNPLNAAPQLRDDYRKGYDRLTNGLGISEFVGYYYFSDNRILNFYAGFESLQAWTKCRRDYNFDDMSVDNSKRFELSTGFKVGWIIKLSGRNKKDYFYY